MRNAVTSGARCSCRCSRTLANTGVSVSFSRITSPTTTSRMLIRKGTRHPQDRNCSSGRPDTDRNASVDSTSPAGTPICGRLP